MNSQQPALSPRTNQCDQEEGERGIVFIESKFTVGELVRSAFVSFLPQEAFAGRAVMEKRSNSATLRPAAGALVRPN